MGLYEERKIKIMEKVRIRKEEETKNFLDMVDKVINNTDNIVHPSVQIIKEMDNCYINYCISKYPNCLLYSVTRYKKEYPFNIYHSKEFYQYNIPEKYKKVFLEIETYFK